MTVLMSALLDYAAVDFPDVFALRLARAAKARRPLRVMAGFTPHTDSLHLGHVLVLARLRAFQEAGHEVSFLSRDYLCGRASGAYQENAKRQYQQALRILDPTRAELVFASVWQDTLTPVALANLAEAITQSASGCLDEEGADASPNVNEVALRAGYDALSLQSEIEVGGHARRTPMRVAARIQAAQGQAAQSVVTVQMLPGYVGGEAMHVDHGNTIALNASAGEMIEKIMGLTDSVMWRYCDLFSARPKDEIQALKWSVGAGANIQAIKIDLAVEIATRFHSAEVVDAARRAYLSLRDGAPSNGVLDIHVATAPEGMLLARMLMECGLVASSAEGNRMIDEQAVRVDQTCVADRGHILRPGPSYLLQVGTLRVARVTLRPIMSRAGV